MLHYFNAIILFLIICNIFENKKIAFFSALIFLIHPINVEVVSWIGDRKGILSAFFTLLSIYFYTKFNISKTNKIFYILSILFFCFGLLSKAVFVSLPLVLIIIDWYLYKGDYNKKNLVRSFYVIIPFLILSLIVGVITIFVHSQSGAIVSNDLNPIYNRFGNATNSYIVYLKQYFYPFNLSFLYRYQPISSIYVFANIIIISIIFYISYIYRKSKRYLIFGIAWYTLFLLPVIGIVQSGFHAHADRYTYIPLIGFNIIIAFLVVDIVNKLKLNLLLVKGVGFVFILLLMFISSTQVTTWKNSKYLYEHALLIDNSNYAANTNLALIYIHEKNLSKALYHYERAKNAAPYFIKMYNLISDNLLLIEELDIAIDVLYDQMKNNGNSIVVFLKISKILISQRNYLQAEKVLLKARDLSDSSAEINYLLAFSYYKLKKDEQAINVLTNSINNEIYNNNTKLLLKEITANKN